MKFLKGGINILRVLLVSILMLVIRPMYDSGQTNQTRPVEMFCFSGKTFTCGIDLGDDMRSEHGLETGLAYEILQSFARDHQCELNVLVGGKDTNYLEKLQNGQMDLLLTHKEAAEKADGIMLSQNITDCSVIAAEEYMIQYIHEINCWLDTYTQSEEFIQLKEIFSRQNDPVKLAEKGIKRESLSPYDELIKRYAKDLGWDWRMLAAVVYQESKFSINSRSHRGAAGLMQVMPKTGSIYGVEDLINPENNLIAGTSHLKRLQKLYKSSDMTPEERICFTLAAYNAGEGRVKDCRSLAKAQNLDHNLWSDVAKVIPQMNTDSILADPNVKHGKFKGKETLAYIENVMNLYSSICKVCPEN